MKRRDFLKALGAYVATSAINLKVEGNEEVSRDYYRKEKDTPLSNNKKADFDKDAVKKLLDERLNDVHLQLESQGRMSHFSVYEELLTKEMIVSLERGNSATNVPNLPNSSNIYLTRGGAFGYELSGTTVTITCMNQSQFVSNYAPSAGIIVAESIISAILGYSLTPLWGALYGLLFGLSTAISSWQYSIIISSGGNAKIISTSLNGETSTVILNWDTYPYITIPVGVYHFKEF